MTSAGDQKNAVKVTHREEKLKANLLSRLSRIEGQIRGITGMIEKDAYCDNVLNQISAVRAALDATGKLLLENHLRHCVVERIMDGEDDVVDELVVTIGKLIK